MLSIITQWFIDSSMNLDQAIPSRYDPKLVVLSVIVPSLAGYAALNIVERIRVGNKMISERSWLLIGAITMGSGVWAMHFIAMLAFQLPVPVNYNFWVTLASVFPVILASAVTLYVISRATCDGKQLIVGGVLMGAGIGVMHYTGMAAMRSEALMRFDPLIFALSVVVAVSPFDSGAVCQLAGKSQEFRVKDSLGCVRSSLGDGFRRFWYALHRYECRLFFPRKRWG